MFSHHPKRIICRSKEKMHFFIIHLSKSFLSFSVYSPTGKVLLKIVKIYPCLYIAAKTTSLILVIFP